MTIADLIEILTRELGADLAARVGETLCREAAGETLYVSRRAVPPVILPGDTPRTVQARYGIPVRTARDWVHRWRT